MKRTIKFEVEVTLDESVEQRIRRKGRQDLTVENDDEEPHENQENQHPHQEDTWG